MRIKETLPHFDPLVWIQNNTLACIDGSEEPDRLLVRKLSIFESDQVIGADNAPVSARALLKFLSSLRKYSDAQIASRLGLSPLRASTRRRQGMKVEELERLYGMPDGLLVHVMNGPATLGEIALLRHTTGFAYPDAGLRSVQDENSNAAAAASSGNVIGKLIQVEDYRWRARAEKKRFFRDPIREDGESSDE